MIKTILKTMIRSTKHIKVPVLITVFIVITAVLSGAGPGERDAWSFKPVPVTADFQTEPVHNPGDSADDPAFWYYAPAPEKSLIIGTDKREGLLVYDLQGREKQFLRDGRLNNVDLRYSFTLESGEVIDIALATNRTTDTIEAYRIDPKTLLTNITSPGNTYRLRRIYGITLYKNTQYGMFFVFVSARGGKIEQLLVYEDEKYPGTINYRKVAEITLASTAEGLTADDEENIFFAAEELAGIWSFSLNPLITGRGILEAPAGAGSGLFPDIEGITIYRSPDNSLRKKILFASSQGSSTFAAFEMDGRKLSYINSFYIDENTEKGIDRVTETDGIEAVNHDLSIIGMPEGIFISHDDDNSGQNQNFKIVDIRKIKKALGLQQLWN